MKLLSIGKSDLKTPYIGMGTWAIGGGVWWGENDDVLSIHTVHEALDHGITWIDTAPVYGVGHSEEVVGKALKDRRHSAILSTKCGLEWRPHVSTKSSKGNIFTEICLPKVSVRT